MNISEIQGRDSGNKKPGAEATKAKCRYAVKLRSPASYTNRKKAKPLV